MRSPLNGIIGLTEIVHDGRAGPLSTEQKEYLSDVLFSARHLLRLVTNVLDLVSIEAGKIDQKPEPLDIKAAVEQVQSGSAALAVAKGIRIHTTIDAGLNRLVADRARIQQIVFNYLSNALKFTPDGGSVTVRVVREDADYFRIEVQDTGPGIREEDPAGCSRNFSSFMSAWRHGRKAPGSGSRSRSESWRRWAGRSACAYTRHRKRVSRDPAASAGQPSGVARRFSACEPLGLWCVLVRPHPEFHLRRPE